MLPPLQIKSTEGWISLLPCRTVEARAAVAIFITGLCQTEDLLQEESISEKMNSQYVRFEVFGCETEELTDFWEKTIEKQTKHLQIEKERQQRSALPKVSFKLGCEGENCDDNPDQKNPNTSLTTFNDINNLNSERRRRNPSEVLPFTGLTDASKLNRSCCQNGGTCFLGSFCICPKHFTGRHCERDKRISSCGVIGHGEWTQEGCLFCQCIYGILHCFPQDQKDGCGPTKKNMPAWIHLGMSSEGLKLQHTTDILIVSLLFPLLCQLL
ncbi:unnamed protein product [Lepidochelys kempii]